MTTITFEYDDKNDIVSELLQVIAKMPGVKTFLSKEKTSQVLSEKEIKMAWLRKEAIALDKSINKKAPKMTMEEIVQEVRDYRNGK